MPTQQKKQISSKVKQNLKPRIARSQALTSVHLVPTYRCNLACPYCYASKYIGKHGEMTWRRYISTLDRLIANNIRHIQLIGGEPTIWPHIDEAIQTAHSLGIRVSLLSNAIKRIQTIPSTITTNATNLYIAKLEPVILSNLDWYRSHGTKVTLRFNFGPKNTKTDLQKAIKWSKKHADYISFAPIVPHTLTTDIGQILYDFAVLAVRAKMPLTISRAIPLCIFTPEQRIYMREHAGLYSRCSPADRGLTINPDGTILPCVDLDMPMPASNDLNKSKEKFHAEIDRLYEQPIQDKCKSCMFFPHACQGGCLAMKCG